MSILVKNKKARKDQVFLNQMAIQVNGAVLEYCRTSTSALAGGAAGILGLTGLYGFLFYFVISLILSVMLTLKAGAQWHKHFRSRLDLFTSGLFGGLFTYILFWTFLYGMVHVY